jgi:hypothetical protein
VLHAHPGNGLVGQIVIEDIVRLPEIRLDRSRILVECRMPLIAVAAEKAVKYSKPRPLGHGAVESKPDRQKLAKRFGADVVIDPTKGDLEEAARPARRI